MTSTKTRSCGGCTACCHTHSVDMDGVYTPRFKDCSHCVIGVGCGVYESRPYSCSIYRCLWLTGMPDHMRPDKFGVVLDVWTVPNETMRFLNFWEVYPGRLNEPDVGEFIEGLLATRPYVIICRRPDFAVDIRFPHGIDIGEQERLTRTILKEIQVQGEYANA